MASVAEILCKKGLMYTASPSVVLIIHHETSVVNKAISMQQLIELTAWTVHEIENINTVKGPFINYDLGGRQYLKPIDPPMAIP